MDKLKIIGDDIYFDNEIVAKFVIPENTLRGRFLEAIDAEPDALEEARTEGYDEGYDEGYNDGYAKAQEEVEE